MHNHRFSIQSRNHTVATLRTTQTHTIEPKTFHNQSEVKNGQKRHTSQSKTLRREAAKRFHPAGNPEREHNSQIKQ
jgi:hypothetical protein